MISILHLSDLHIVQSGHWHNLRSCILEEARSVRSRPREEKLLVLTGDFRNFWDSDYSKAKAFLTELFTAMDIDPATGVFVVPGNHDVGNDTLMNECFPGDKDWDMRKESSVLWLKNHNSSEGGYKRYLRWRMESYRPFCQFLEKLGIPDADGAAAPHVRQWPPSGKPKLNLFHLNTTLVADGKQKDNQRVDLLTATDHHLWEGLDPSLPALALGHNSFFDLDKSHQTALEAVFSRHNVCAYLCGDTHKEELDRDRQRIRLTSGYSDGAEIPNIVGVKGAADDSDNYSDFGLYWHEWDEDAGVVHLRLLSWNPKVDQAEFLQGRAHDYKMPRRDGTNPPPDSGTLPRSNLRDTLDVLLEDVRKNHPSFKLMERDSIDRRLCPDVKDAKLLPSLGSVEKGAKKPVWALISESWKLSENHSIVIEGVGGIGKTVTLLRPDLQGTELPVPALYIPLYELVGKDDKCLSVDEYLERRLPGHKEEICDLAEQPWQSGPKLLLLLDGFNEIPQKHRFAALNNLNEWRKSRTGVQLIAVSRPMDSLDLSKELAGSPIALHLSPLEPETVKNYLTEQKVTVPDENSPVWKVLTQPLFLVLYAKTDVLRGRTAAGYPLRPKEAVSGGALIWNYLQRELLKQNRENWVLCCAVACQYVLPFVAYHMAKNHRFTIDRDELKQVISAAVLELNPEHLPKHLQKLYGKYDEVYEDCPDFSKVKWTSQVLMLEILVKNQKTEKTSYSFLHQHFRDALAGMYLVGQAEAAPEGTLPEVWQTSHSPELMDYAAELMEEEDDTAQKLWSCVQTQNPLDKRCFYVQMELHSRRGADGLARMNFSGMDLRDVSLIQYKNGLFRKQEHTRGTRFNRATFEGVGHRGPVYCVAALKDGRVVSGSWDNTLRIWDPNTGDCVGMLEGHTNSVNCVAALSDGRIVSGSNDNTLRVWNPDTGECLNVLEGHTALVLCVAELSDGRIVSGSSDKTLRVWNPDTGESRVLKGHTYRVHCVAELANGRIVSGSRDKTLRVWNPDIGECLNVLEGHTDLVNCVAALSDGRIISGSWDNTLRVWNPDTGECLNVLEGHTALVLCVAELSDGRIVSGSGDNTLRVWNPDTGESRALEGHTRSVSCVAVLSDGRIVTGSYDKTLLLWTTNSNTPQRRLGRVMPEVSCAVLLSGNRWATGHTDGSLRLWDASQRRYLRSLKGHTNTVTCLTALKDGRIVSGSGDNTLRVWNPDTGECRVLKGHTHWVHCVAALSDGRIISGSWDKTLRVWNPDTGESRVLEGHTSLVYCVAALSDGRIVSGSHDYTLRVWNPNTGECLNVLEKHKDYVNCVAALPDERIVSGSSDKTLRVWNPDTGECLNVLEEQDYVNCVAALADGRIVSGSRYNTLRVWNPDTGKCLNVLKGHTDWVRCVLPLDSAHILSGSKDCTLRLWNVNTGKCLCVIPVSEMEVLGLDLRGTKMDEETARFLYCNGAEVPEEYTQKFLNEGVD